LFTSSFAGLVPNIGLGPYCVAKYGVVALAEVLHRELRDSGIGVSVLCPMRVATEIKSSHRNRPADLGGPGARRPQSSEDRELRGAILDVDTVACQVIEAIGTTRLYILPHEDSRQMIERRFARIARAFED
jgi:short-subunit dehydrogenase